MAAEPGFIGEISDRNAFVNAANHALNDPVFFAGGQTCCAHVLWNIQRQIQGRQNQLNRLIPRIVRTMTVPDVGGTKAADGPTQHVLNGMQFVYCFIDKNFIHYSLQGMLA
ncbi:hypothetical protein D3C72_1447700 [compost metagenome]